VVREAIECESSRWTVKDEVNVGREEKETVLQIVQYEICDHKWRDYNQSADMSIVFSLPQMKESKITSCKLRKSRDLHSNPKAHKL
jgi:hypothetical protein